MEKNSSVAVRKFAYEDFDEKKVLGEGSFNQVYYAKHKLLGPCVLKIVSRAFYVKPKQKKKLEDEARNMFSLQHENLIHGYGVVMEPEHLCLVFEYAEFGCLADALRRITIPWSIKIRTAYQISVAIEYLHNQIDCVVHRNLKSSNILYGNEFNVKVSDYILPKSTLWLSHATQHKEITDRKKKVEGKSLHKQGSNLAHIAPEIMQNINAQADKPYDVYSFGVILWELLTNDKPFKGASTEEVYKKMTMGFKYSYEGVLAGRPQLLFDIMDKALRSNPNERPTFSETVNELKPLHLSTTAEALCDVSTCKQEYEIYKATRKERQLNSQVSTESGRFHSAGDPTQGRTFVPVTPPGKNSAFEGETVKSTAPPVKPNVQRSQQQTAATEKGNVSSLKKSESYEEMEHSATYTESTDQNIDDKATPFTDEPVQIPQANQAIYNFQGDNINVVVNDRMAPSAGEPAVSRVEPPPTSPIPARGSQRRVDQADTFLLVQHVGSNWKFLARATGMSEGQIDAIHHDYDRDGLNEKIFQVVNRWLRKNGMLTTVGQLVQILEYANLQEVAHMLTP